MGWLRFALGAVVLILPFAIAYWVMSKGDRNDDSGRNELPYSGGDGPHSGD